MLDTRRPTVFASALVLAALLPFTAAEADVTTQQKTTMNLGITKMTMTATDQISGDHQRQESDMKCDGLMSMLCGKNKTARITRLDKSVEWELKVDKKHYTEKPFPTPAEQAAALKKLKELMQKMKDCPTAATEDKNCELSPPKLEVKQTDEHATIAGHETRKTSVTMTQISTCKDSSDVCEIVYGFDSWLTPDTLPGTDEQRAFQQRYLKQIGLDSESMMSMMGGMSSMMGPYADMMQQLKGKASALKGTSLRTTFRMTMGGEKCGKAKQAKAEGAPDAGTSVGGMLGGMVGGSLGQLGGKLLGGFAGRKKQDAPADGSAGSTQAAAPANVATMMETTTETVSIDTNSIAAGLFEIPSGFTKDEIPQDKSKDEDYTCPATPGSKSGGKPDRKSGN
jgi:hypothetical protein